MFVSNKINNAGAQALADMLFTNMTIQNVCLTGNEVSEKVKHELVDNLQLRTSCMVPQHKQNRCGDESDRSSQRKIAVIPMVQVTGH